MSDTPLPITIPVFPPNLVSGQVTLQDLNRLVDEKLRDAVYLWALIKMGDQRDALLDRARHDFDLMFALAWGSLPADRHTPDRLMEMVREIPVVVPQKLSNKNPVPDPGLAELQRIYRTVLEDIKKWKRAKGQPRMRTMALMTLLPGLPYDVVSNWRLKMNKNKLRPSDVAFEYLAKRNGFSSGDALKKQLSVVRSVRSITQRIVERIAREAGLKNPSSPPITPER